MKNSGEVHWASSLIGTSAFCDPPSTFCSRSSIIGAPRLERGGCRCDSCRERQFTGMWLNPNSRGSRLRIWQPWGCNSLHAHHSRRLASAGIADPGDLKSPSLPGASPGSPSGVWLIGNSRPIRLKIEQPWECKSPHADQFGISTGRASRTCLLNSGLPEKGVWCESTAFRSLQTATMRA